MSRSALLKSASYDFRDDFLVWQCCIGLRIPNSPEGHGHRSHQRGALRPLEEHFEISDNFVSIIKTGREEANYKEIEYFK